METFDLIDETIMSIKNFKKLVSKTEKDYFEQLIVRLELIKKSVERDRDIERKFR